MIGDWRTAINWESREIHQGWFRRRWFLSSEGWWAKLYVRPRLSLPGRWSGREIERRVASATRSPPLPGARRRTPTSRIRNHEGWPWGIRAAGHTLVACGRADVWAVWFDYRSRDPSRRAGGGGCAYDVLEDAARGKSDVVEFGRGTIRSGKRFRCRFDRLMDLMPTGRTIASQPCICTSRRITTPSATAISCRSAGWAKCRTSRRR